MSNFIKNYLSRMRGSDEKTKHRSALSISIIASVIILSISFIFLKDSFFNFSPKNKIGEVKKNNVESPISSFSKFFKDSKSQFSNLKSTFGDISSTLKDVSQMKEVDQKNISTGEPNQEFIKIENSSTSQDTATTSTLE